MTRHLGLLAPVLLAAALLGCGREGGRARPDTPGPSLRVVQPRPEQHFGIWDPVRKLGWVEVLFSKDDPKDLYRIRFQVADGAPTEVRDIHAALVRKPVEGSHLIRAWLVAQDDRPAHGAGATAVVRIHVGDVPRPELPVGPTLIWAGPFGVARPDDGGTWVDVLVHDPTFGSGARRLRIAWPGAWHERDVRGPLALDSTWQPGWQAFEAVLLEGSDTAGWIEVPGSRIAHEFEIR